MLFNRVAQMYRGDQGKAWVTIAKKATVLQIQQAVDMHALSPQDEWDIAADFPVVIPPWQITWAEWRIPKEFNAGGEMYRVPLQGNLGALIETHRGSRGWSVMIGLFSEAGSPAAMRLSLNDAGKPVLPSDGPYAGQFQYAAYGPMWQQWPRGAWDSIILNFWGYPLLLALSLCHCRNVTMQEHPMFVTRAERRRGDAVVDRYYTLEIESMRRALRAAGSDTSLKNALHLCRGHFKDYRDGSGLFGRLKGLWWWDMQVRGDGTRGQVRKDYSVAAE